MATTYIGGYYHTVLDHYQFAGDHMTNHGLRVLRQDEREDPRSTATDKSIEFFVDLQV